MKPHARNNLICDKYNVGLGTFYLAGHYETSECEEDSDRIVRVLHTVSGLRAYWGHLSLTKRHGAHWHGRQDRLARRYLGGVPASYRCTGCPGAGVKLWRQYQTCAVEIRLLCADCAEKDQQESHKPGWRSQWARRKGDTIGWLVPAVPTEEGTFWGYSSVPEHAVRWWRRLPVGRRPGGTVPSR